MGAIGGAVEPVTALGVLFDAGGRSGEPAVDELERAIGERGQGRAALSGARSVGAATVGLVDREVGVKASSLLDVDLGEVLCAGWARYDALRAAGRRTLADPSTDEVVPLHTHRVTSAHKPRVELLLDGRRIHSFDFRLELALEVEGLSAVVRAGRLVAVRGGKCRGELSLFLGEELLAERSRTWDPELLVDLDPPLLLVADDGRSWPE